MKTPFATVTSYHKRNIPRKRLLLFSLPLLMNLLTACPETSTPTPPAGTKPTITSFTASPATLPAGGGSVTLIWDVEDATSLSIDGGVVTGTSKAVSVMSSTTFTLTATNSAGSSTQTTSVRVEAGADTTPPTVLSVDPPDGATGVKDDASVIVTFSERMNQAATEFSYESLELPTESVTFSWNADGTTLTIKPNDLLEYVAGDDPSIAAKTYAINFSIATDISGNSLPAEFNSSFSTLRLINPIFYATATLDGDCYGSGGCDVSRTTLPVGDLATAPTDSGFRSFVNFDLTEIPAGVVLDNATLAIYKEGITGDPYALGTVRLHHVSYGESLGGEAYDTSILTDFSYFDSPLEPATGYLTGAVTRAVRDDLTNREARGNRSQYRLSFDAENNDNDVSDFVSFTASEGPSGQRPFLQVTYLIP